MNHLLSKWNFKVKSFHFEYVPVRPLHLKKKSWSHQVLIVYRKMVPFCCCYWELNSVTWSIIPHWQGEDTLLGF
jgi:hypothetical protein